MSLKRLHTVRTVLTAAHVDAFLFLDMSNVRYLTGFTGSDGACVVGRDGSWFLTDSRYTTQAAQEVSSAVVEYRSKSEGIVALLRECSAARVGFEPSLSFSFYTQLRDALPGVELVSLGKEVERLREVKDESEIVMLRRVAEVASDALEAVLPRVRPGVEERELAFELEMEMRRRGAERPSFDFIVASGERGALPHGRASGKKIASGELVTFDFGAVLDGYCSDETVTVGVGGVTPRQREIYDIVKDAHDRAIELVKPGVALRDVDAAARDFITGRGYGEYFGHGLGHGVGLEVHEKPVVSFRSDAVAEEGMVFTIEPGIYIPGLGGVRIEDTVVVTASGCDRLTRVSKDFMSV